MSEQEADLTNFYLRIWYRCQKECRKEVISKGLDWNLKYGVL